MVASYGVGYDNYIDLYIPSLILFMFCFGVGFFGLGFIAGYSYEKNKLKKHNPNPIPPK